MRVQTLEFIVLLLLVFVALFAAVARRLQTPYPIGHRSGLLRTGRSIQWLGTVVVADQPAGFTSTHECGCAVLLPCSCHEAVDRGGTGRNDREEGRRDAPAGRAAPRPASA